MSAAITPTAVPVSELRPASDVVFEHFVSHLVRYCERARVGAGVEIHRAMVQAADSVLKDEDSRQTFDSWIATGELGEGMSRLEMSALVRTLRSAMNRFLGAAATERSFANAVRATERLPEVACVSPLEFM